jgi:Tol biopolymer transport system component
VTDSPLPRLAAALSGRYRIERELGAGGMATVYLAHDEKHDRKVAIKVLKPELAAVLGAERFVVEIKTTASLQHPHILPLFDSGTADGFLFYVMPYIQGETIREKLNRETQFGVDEAVRIAREVADALDYAHRNGVIHRDIKPENILLHDGRAMVMDFGIALAVSAAAGGRMTETGLSLGTPHYMSPEQATAEKELTPRSDVYSIASVLYEMLAGQPPHVGGPAQQVIMRIITEEARPVSDFRRNVPPNVVAALAKALEKLPADRFESAKAFGDALGNASFATQGSRGGTSVRTRSWYASPLPYALALTAALAVVAWQATRRAPDAALPVRFIVRPPSDDRSADRINGVSISADGRRIAFISRVGNTRRIHVQDLGSLESQSVPGTEEAVFFALSPDGRELVFQLPADGVRRVAVDGGAVTNVPLPDGLGKILPNGVTWSGQTIVVSLSGVSGVVLVPTAGGPARRVPVTRDGKPCRCVRRTALSHDGTHLLLAGPSAYAVPINGGEIQDLGVAAETIIGIRDDLLLYVTVDGRLMAASIDLRTFKLGTPTAIETRLIPGSSAALSANGALVMITGASSTQLELVDEHGNGTPIGALANTTARIGFPRFSPDGTRIALSSTDRADAAAAISILDIASGTTTRLTTDGAFDRPEWSPDGKRVLFRRLFDESAHEEIWWQPFDRSAAAEPLQRQTGKEERSEGLLSPDGKWLMYRTLAPQTGRDIWYRAMSGDTTSKPFEVTPFDELMPRFSPDGRWVAYTSNETGAPEVFVRPFPGPGGRTQISTGGGTEPVWAPDGRHLFYIRGNDLMSATVSSGSAVTAASRERMFSANSLPGSIHANYDVAKDGRHFLMVRSVGSQSDLTVVLHWLEDAKRRLAR